MSPFERHVNDTDELSHIVINPWTISKPPVDDEIACYLLLKNVV